MFFLNLCEHVTTVHCLSVEVLFRSQLWMWYGDSNGGIGVRPVCFYGQLFWRSMVAGWGAQQYSAPSRDTPVSDDAGVGKQDLPVHWKRPWTLHPICCMITQTVFYLNLQRVTLLALWMVLIPNPVLIQSHMIGHRFWTNHGCNLNRNLLSSFGRAVLGGNF